MSVNAKEMQQKLWDILGKPEKKQFAYEPILNGKRILSASGTVRYDGESGSSSDGSNSSNSEDDSEEDDNDNGNGKNNGNGSDNDPRRDPAAACPKVGDEIPGLKNMRDCNTGQCVNVGFTMPAKPPEGWSDACTPPDATDGWQAGVYWQAYYTAVCYGKNETYQTGTQNFKTFDEARYWLASKTIADVADWAASGYASGGWRYPRAVPCDGGGQWAMRKYSSSDPQWQTPPQAAYPANTCTEIEYKAGQFQAACDKDPNIPPQFKTPTTAMQLCDANGNTVTIEPHGRGWKYTTASCTVLVSDSGVATSVQAV